VEGEGQRERKGRGERERQRERSRYPAEHGVQLRAPSQNSEIMT